MSAGRVRQAGTVLATGLLVVGCAGREITRDAVPVSEKRASAPATPTSSGLVATWTTIDPDAATKADVEQAYRDAIAAVQDAVAIPDPDLPALASRNTGAMLTRWKQVAATMRSNGLIARFPAHSVHRVTVQKVELESPTLATVEACEVDDGVVSHISSGVVVDDSVSSYHNRGTMIRSRNSWMLTYRSTVAKEGGVTC